MLRELGGKIARLLVAHRVQVAQPFEAVKRGGIRSARNVAVEDRPLADSYELAGKTNPAGEISVGFLETGGTRIEGLNANAIGNPAAQRHPVKGALPQSDRQCLKRAAKGCVRGLRQYGLARRLGRAPRLDREFLGGLIEIIRGDERYCRHSRRAFSHSSRFRPETP